MWSSDPSINPYGISFRALEPGNTPDLVFQALVPNSVLKLSFGVGLVGTYLGGSTTGRIAPVVDKWIATAAADEPQRLRVWGPLRPIDARHGDEHDAAGPRLALGRLPAGAPRAALALGAGIRRRPLHAGHGDLDVAPRAEPATSIASTCRWAATPRPRRTRSVEQDKLDTQRRFLDAVMQGRALPRPNVVYWTREPTVEVPADSYAYPSDAWYRQTADSWPPAKVADATYRLGADGSATQGSASSGVTYLSPLTEDERNDPVAAAALSGTPLGTSPLSSVPATDLPGFIASFRTPRSPRTGS